MGAGALLHSVGSRFLTDMGGVRKHMKKTYIFMLLAGLSLAGAPLITSGFWSKDSIFAAYVRIWIHLRYTSFRNSCHSRNDDGILYI